jgi:hypothetical protein
VPGCVAALSSVAGVSLLQIVLALAAAGAVVAAWREENPGYLIGAGILAIAVFI